MTTAAAPKKEPFRRVSGDEQATRLIALYKRAEKEISTKLLQAVMKAGTKKALSVRRLEQELKAVYKMLDELKKAGESVSVEMVTAAFSGGIRVARKQLEAAGVIEKGTIVAEMGGVNEKAMKVYSSMIGERLADVVTTAGRTTADIYRQLELDSILTGTVSGYETINSKIREMEKTCEAQGLVAFVDRSGREWNMSTYVEMLARTTVMKIHNEAVKNEFIAHGEDLVIISYHLPTCEMCKPWNGKIVSLTGATKDYPTMTEAEADGLFHPNCRHAFSLYIPENVDVMQSKQSSNGTLEEEQLRNLVHQLEEGTPEVKAERAKIKAELDRHFSSFTAEQQAKVEQEVQRIADLLRSDDVSVVVNIPSHYLQNVLEEGRFKSLFETRKSGGSTNLSVRKNAENLTLGVPSDTEAAKRPIYGYLLRVGADFDYNRIKQYGNVTVILKNDVKHRSSCVIDDSLNMSSLRQAIAQPVMNVDRYLLSRKEDSGEEALKALRSVAEVKTESGIIGGGIYHRYTEAQIFGQVTLDDIEEVVFLKPNVKVYGSDDKLRSKLDELGIKHKDSELYGTAKVKTRWSR